MLRSEITMRMPGQSDSHIGNGEHQDFDALSLDLSKQVTPIVSMIQNNRKDLRLKLVQIIVVWEKAE